MSLFIEDSQEELQSGLQAWIRMITQNRFLRNSIIYTLGIVLNKTLGFFLIPLYTKYFTVAEYGVISILNVIYQLASFIFLMGISSSAMRFYFNEGADEEYRKKLYGNAVLLGLFFPAVLFMAFIPLVYVLLRRFFPEIPFFPLGITVLGINVFSPLTILLLGLYRVKKMARSYVAYSFSLFFVQALLCIAAVVLMNGGIKGQFYAQFLANVLFWGIALAVLKRHSTFAFSRPMAKALVGYGLPLIPYFIFLWMESASVRVFLEQFGSFAEVGIFSLASQFAGVLVIIGTALDNTITPFFFERAQKPDGPVVLGKLFGGYIAFFGVFTILVSIIAEPLVRIMTNPRYHSAIVFIPLMVFGVFLNLVFRIFNWSLMYSKRTKTLSLLILSTTLLLLLLLLLFLGKWRLGIWGAIYATILMGVVRIVAGYHFSNRYFRIQFDSKRLAVHGLIILGGFAIVTFVRFPGTMAAAFGLKMGVFILILFLLTMAGGFREIFKLLKQR